jgi:hypothetical protein
MYFFMNWSRLDMAHVRNAVTNIPIFKSDKLETDFWDEGCNGVGSAHIELVSEAGAASAAGEAARALVGVLLLLLDLDLDPVVILIVN